MENVQKIRIKLGNIWIDLIRSIYAPYRPYIKNIDILFPPKKDTKVYYDFGNDKDQEWLVEEILAHKWNHNDLELQVKWLVGDVTWELLSSCKDLEALDIYLEL